MSEEVDCIRKFRVRNNIFCYNKEQFCVKRKLFINIFKENGVIGFL